MRQLFMSRVGPFFFLFLFLWRSGGGGGVFQKGALRHPFDYFLLHTKGVQMRVPTRNAGEARTRLSSGAGGGRRRRAPTRGRRAAPTVPDPRAAAAGATVPEARTAAAAACGRVLGIWLFLI